MDLKPKNNTYKKLNNDTFMPDSFLYSVAAQIYSKHENELDKVLIVCQVRGPVDLFITT